MDASTHTNVFPLLELPQVVIDKVVSFLPPTACLALRKVCRRTHNWIANKSYTALEVEKWKRLTLRITGKDPYTFATLVKMNLPISSFHLRNNWSRQKIYESEGIEEFLELYKSRNITLIVDVLYMFRFPREKDFYSRLENVAGLKVHKLRTATSASLPYGDTAALESIETLYSPPPSTLTSSLKALVIKDYDHPSFVPDDIILTFITSFKNLELLSPPPKVKKIRWVDAPWLFLSRKSTYCPRWMDALGIAIVENDWRSIQQTRVKLTIDLRSFMSKRYTERSYLSYVQNYVRLLQESHRCNFVLRYVYSPIVESMYSYWQDLGWSQNGMQESLTFLDSVASLHSVSNVLRFGFCEMKRLEDISIVHHFGNHQWLYHDPPELGWNSLKSLKISVYITEEYLTQFGKRVWDVTFRRVFENDKRRSVNNLMLKVTTDPGMDEDMVYDEDFNGELFNVSIITANFTSLKFLTIQGWNAPSEYIQKLFSGLPRLAYVSIAACRGLSNSVFKSLTAVKTLILYLDEMPQLTEHLFTQFLCRMPLKELRIIAKKPLRQLTTKAIKALQEGQFGSTIESFPFDTWKSKFIKEKEKKQLKKGFRFVV